MIEIFWTACMIVACVVVSLMTWLFVELFKQRKKEHRISLRIAG